MLKIVLTLFSILLFFATTTQAQQSKEEEAIKKVIQTSYIDAIYNVGDTTAMRQGFHETFQLLGLKEDNSMRVLGIDEWVALVQKRKEDGKYPPLPQNKVSVNFIRIEVIEEVASAKIEFLVGKEVKYVDFLALYKFKEGWKIVNKVYHTMP